MSRRLILLLGVAIVVAIVAWFLTPPSRPSHPPDKLLGKPRPTGVRTDLDQLAFDIVFDQKHLRIVSRQKDGKIVSWNIATGQANELAITSAVFAYCPEQGLLLFSDSAGSVYLRDLNREETNTVTTKPRHHGAWTTDCSKFVLAEETAGRQLEIWSAEALAIEASATAAMEVRNGIAISAGGNFIAAAEGKYGDVSGHDTQLEIFALSQDGHLAPVVLIDQQDMVLGMWKMAFAAKPDRLFVGSQVDAKSGLEVFAASSGAQLWTKDGFASYWVRALALSADAKLLATGDEKGLFRLWDAETGDKLTEINTGQVVQSVSFSDDGHTIALSQKDTTIALYNVGRLLGAD